MKLKIKKLSKNATIPTRANAGDAGYDFYALNPITVPTDTVATIRTGIACKCPDGFWMKIFDRSGMFTTTGMQTGAGVIDNGYTGEIIICVMNNSMRPIQIRRGDKIAQGVLLPLVEAEIKEVSDLEKTERGDKGFGSSDE